MDEPANPPGSGAAPAARRAPAQQRSRDRLDRILTAATQLISAKGSDQVKMSEVAELAGVSIGSLYQYFPDKSGIIRTLAERNNARSRAYIEAAFAKVHDAEQLQSAFGTLVDDWYRIMLADPAMRDVWSAVQADKQLAALELAENRACAALLAEALQRAYPEAAAAAISLSAFVLWQLGEAAMRLAISLERPEGDAVMSAYRRMTVRELREFGSGE